MMRNGGKIFAVLCLVAAGALALILYQAKHRATVGEAVVPAVGAAASSTAAAGRVYFRYTGPDAHYGQLAYVDSGSDGRPAFVEGLRCEAVHVAADRGICLEARRGVVTTYSAHLFDTATFRILATLPLEGVPSRTRLSADGSLAAATVFVTGHSYASVDFSTQTVLIDVTRARVLATLEQFAVFRSGERFAREDFNFWGVTFTPDGRFFYATLSTGVRHYLIRGELARRAAEIVHENVECPSLSPDLTRVAYKKRVTEAGRVLWQLQVLDLASGRETPLSERRSIDDQLEWLDDRHVLYSVPDSGGAGGSTEVWSAAADGSGVPALFLKRAYSPAVAR